MPRPEPRKPLGHQYTCPQCGIAFTGRTKVRRYCSYTCANAARGHATANPLRMCPICGTPITRYADKAPSLYARIQTCSRSCGQALSRQSRPQLTPLTARPCRRCGKDFVPPNRVNKGIYCSNACHLADLHEAGRDCAATVTQADR